ILASRTVFVADDGGEARRLAGIGLRRHRAYLATIGRELGGESLDAMIAAMDAHLGTPDEVIASLQTDTALARATDVAVQVHSIGPPAGEMGAPQTDPAPARAADVEFRVHSIAPPHPFPLRSIELVGETVAP